MNRWKSLSAVALTAALLINGVASAQDRRAASDGIVEIVPTGRTTPATWRYTFDGPEGDAWTKPAFDDHAWQTGRSGFGAPGTPAVVVSTRWNTPDIWLRREITLPAALPPSASLQLLVFHDEDVEIYLDGVLAARDVGFVRDYAPVEIAPDARAALKPGAKVVIAVHCRQTTGGQGIDVGLVSLSPEALAARRHDRYHAFASSSPGDPANGRRLFMDEQRLACSRCHTTDGSAGRAGPDLFAAGDKFTRPELARAILEPSADIAIGYATTVLTTKRGDELLGVIKEASDAKLGLMTGDGKLHHVATADVRSRVTQRASLMPDGLESSLSPGEFADLVAYLASLRLPAFADAGRVGQPANIPELRPPVALVPIHSDAIRFEHPCWLGQLPGEPGTFLVCEHETGHVWRLTTANDAAGTAESKFLFADFRAEIRPGGATGLLGLAFHPHFRENRKYYIQHQLTVNGRIVARVSEKLASADFLRDSGTPSRTIIEFACSTDVHSGGGIAFGPDGMLYIGMGDTGPQGDPEGHGQDLRTPLGKMLRIDVDHPTDDRAYSIPPDNPFRNRADARGEIWAYGFREPWRFSFDPATNDLWVGDVGQDRIEEVDVVRRGENYGWNVYEGFDLFSTRRRSEGTTYAPPVFAYDRRLGNSITGGYVYRSGLSGAGAGGSPFDGVYVCADYTSRRVWGIKQIDRKLTTVWQLCRAPQEVTSFARDDAGTLYLVGYQGTIYRMDFTTAKLDPPPAADAK